MSYMTFLLKKFNPILSIFLLARLFNPKVRLKFHLVSLNFPVSGVLVKPEKVSLDECFYVEYLCRCEMQC